MRQSPEETRRKLPRVVSQQSYRMGLISPAMKLTIHMKSLPRKFIRDSAAKVFIGGYFSPGCSLGGLMLKLKLQYSVYLMWRVDSLEKTLMLGGIGGRRRREWHRMRWLDGITDSMDMSLSNSGSWWWTGRPGMLWFMGSQRVGHHWATELNWCSIFKYSHIGVRALTYRF